MNEQDRKHIEARLLEERRRVTDLLSRYATQHEAADQQDESGDLTKMPFHMADQGTETQQSELEAVMADRETANLNEIDAALERLYKQPDKFGLDETTGQPISMERLDIIPWARTSK